MVSIVTAVPSTTPKATAPPVRGLPCGTLHDINTPLPPPMRTPQRREVAEALQVVIKGIEVFPDAQRLSTAMWHLRELTISFG